MEDTRTGGAARGATARLAELWRAVARGAKPALSAEPKLETEFSERCYPLNVDSPHVDHMKGDADAILRFFLVDVTGQSMENIKDLISIACADLKSRSVIPIFVTDLSDYRVFREAGVIFEAVPNVRVNAQRLSELDWIRRRADVLALIHDKWKPSGSVNLSHPDVQ